MKVFVTGGTGFVAAHTALALFEAGHSVRFLVRKPDAIKRYFSGHGYDVDDLVVADMCDKEAVISAMQGCDAVFHAAASVCLDPSKAEETYRTNVEGMNTVVGAARELGIDRIVYVSSVTVLFNRDVETIDEQSPLAECHDAYSRSKRDADAYARELQQQGVPVQLSYPSGVIGPHDPKLSEVNRAITTFLTSILPRTSSGIQFVDVRDLAQAHRYMLENPPVGNCSDGRYIVGGPFKPWNELRQTLEGVTGRRLFSPWIPGVVFRAAGVASDWVRRFIPYNTDVTAESMSYISQWVPADSSRIQGASGLQFRSSETTFRDTIGWMVSTGHLDQASAGKLNSTTGHFY